MEKEIIKLWDEYLEWLTEVKHIQTFDDMTENFASFMRWLRIYK